MLLSLVTKQISRYEAKISHLSNGDADVGEIAMGLPPLVSSEPHSRGRAARDGKDDALSAHASPQTKQSTQTKQSRPFIVLPILGVFVVFGGYLTYIGAGSIMRELRLRDGGHTIAAEVLGSRIMESRRGTSHELRYRFQLPGSPIVYTMTDETGRDDLWASVASKADWDAARSSGRVLVSYLPEDPTKNRPVQAGAMPLGDSIAGLVLGLMMAIPCAIGAVMMMIGRIRRAPAAVR